MIKPSKKPPIKPSAALKTKLRFLAREGWSMPVYVGVDSTIPVSPMCDAIAVTLVRTQCQTLLVAHKDCKGLRGAKASDVEAALAAELSVPALPRR